MKNTVMVDGDKTLGEGQDGTLQCVCVEATIKFPKESSWKYKKGDEFIVMSNTDGDVTITGEDGVTMIPAGVTLTTKSQSANVKYEGGNKYLIWGSLCIALITGVAALAYAHITQQDDLLILINWVK